MNELVTIAGVGDVMVDRPEPTTLMSHAAGELRAADIAFAQLETSYSHLGSQGSSGPRGAMHHNVSNFEALPDAGLAVISLASNHAMDWGKDAMLDCLDRMQKAGIAGIGAGANRAAARQPAVLTRKDIRIAFLAYCSVAPKGYYAADPDKAGVNPMRAMTHYEPLEEDQPGTPCEIHTFADKSDLSRLVEDIGLAREAADVVIVSLHWGVHRIRSMIADYQVEVAHAAIRAGADAILGHHPHKLKAVESYQQKPIFYSLGNFAFDRNPRPSRDREWYARCARVYESQFSVPDPVSGSKYTWEADARYSMISRIHMSRSGVQAAEFRPVIIDSESRPVPYAAESQEGKEVVEYLISITNEAGFPPIYEPCDDGWVSVRLD